VKLIGYCFKVRPLMLKRHVEWWVLNWNEPAQAFYRSLGAEPQHDWTVWRVAVS
jgi:hypothetical protein